MRDRAEQFAEQFSLSREPPVSVSMLRTCQFEQFSVTAFGVDGPTGMRLGAARYDVDGRLAGGGFLSSGPGRGPAWGTFGGPGQSSIIVALDASRRASTLRLTDGAGRYVEDTPVNGVAILRMLPGDVDMPSATAQWLDPDGAALDSFTPLPRRRPQTAAHRDGS